MGNGEKVCRSQGRRQHAADNQAGQPKANRSLVQMTFLAASSPADFATQRCLRQNRNTSTGTEVDGWRHGRSQPAWPKRYSDATPRKLPAVVGADGPVTRLAPQCAPSARL